MIEAQPAANAMSPRRSQEEMVDTPLRLVYIAGNMGEATEAERLLGDGEIDYALRLEPFTTTSFLVGNQYMGLYFYVPSAQVQACRNALQAGGMTPLGDFEVDESMEEE